MTSRSSPEISPATFEALSALVNLSSAELSDHLDLTVAMLLAYEGADISAEIQAISTLVCISSAEARST
jgi:hypothetical protein